MFDRLAAIQKVRDHFSQPGAVMAVGDFLLPGDSEEYKEWGCIYRGDQNPASKVRCAFGALIPDGFYRPNMEAKNASAVIIDNPDLYIYLGEPDENDRHWLDRLQRAHDSIANAHGSVESFLVQLDDMAALERAREDDGA